MATVKTVSGNDKKFLVWIVFILSPLFSLFIALGNFKKGITKNVLWAFTAFFGYTLQIPPGFTGDASSYKEKFLLYGIQKTNLKDVWGNFFSNSGQIEIVEKLISVTVSQFSSDYHILFLAYGIFFGYFFSRNIDYLHTAINHRVLNKGSVWITIALFLVIPIWNISGFDFWTASQVFIYAILPFVVEGKIKRLLFIIITPLIHFSFYLVIFLSFVFILLKRFRNGIVLFYILSFFVFAISGSISFSFINSYLPEIIARRTQNYLNSDISNSGGNIIRLINTTYIIILNYISLIIYNRNKKFVNRHNNLYRIFMYSFFLQGVFNILSVIPSVGRFLLISQFFTWVSLFLLLNAEEFLNTNKVKNTLYTIRPILLFVWFINIVRYLLPLMGIGSILSSPLWVNSFVNNDKVIGNLLDFIK